MDSRFGIGISDELSTRRERAEEPEEGDDEDNGVKGLDLFSGIYDAIYCKIYTSLPELKASGTSYVCSFERHVGSRFDIAWKQGRNATPTG